MAAQTVQNTISGFPEAFPRAMEEPSSNVTEFFSVLKLQLRPLSIHRLAKAEQCLLMKSKIFGKWFEVRFPDKI